MSALSEREAQTSPGGRDDPGKVSDVPTDNEAIAYLLQHILSEQQAERAERARERDDDRRVMRHMADTILRLEQLMLGRPCIRPREPEPPCLHLVEGGE